MAVFIFMQNVSFFFLTFLNLGAKIRCPQNRYTDLKSALDQPLGETGVDIGQFRHRYTDFGDNEFGSPK